MESNTFKKGNKMDNEVAINKNDAINVLAGRRAAWYKYPADGPWTVTVKYRDGSQVKQIEVTKRINCQPREVTADYKAAGIDFTKVEDNLRTELYPNVGTNMTSHAYARAKFWDYPENGPWTVTLVIDGKETEITKLPGRVPMRKPDLDRILEKEQQEGFKQAA